MTVLRVDFSDIPYLGAFAMATDEFVAVPSRLGKIPPEAGETLDVGMIETMISASSLIGVMATANSNGVIVPDLIDTDEDRLSEKLDTDVDIVPTRKTALGNQVLANDNGAIVNPDLSDEAIGVIEETLNIEARRSTVAGLKNVGASAVATNKGALLHIEAEEEELEVIENVLDVQADIGTASSGVKYVGTCIVANSNGALTGKNTTGPELGRIENTLGFIE